MPDDKTSMIMGWLEGLARPDWRPYHSDSEVQFTANASLELLEEQEKTIKNLTDIIQRLNQHIKDLSEYMTPYGKVKDIKAAAELLNEHEAVKPRISSVEQRCGNCNKVIEMDGWKACPWCGKRIDWEGWWKKNGTRTQDT